MMAFRIVSFFHGYFHEIVFRRNVENFPTCRESLKDGVHWSDQRLKSRYDEFDGNFEISFSELVLSFLLQLLALIFEIK